VDYQYLIIGKLEHEERVRWLRSLYGHASHSDQPSLLERLSNRLLYVVGRTLMLLGERMQRPQQHTPAAAPVTK
jgi:hypothetical protein